MEPRIHINARDYDTRRHMPVFLYEEIRPMEKQEHPLVSLALWLMIIAAVALTWIMLP